MEFDFATNAKLAATRKGISEEQAMKDLKEIQANSESAWSFGLKVRNYLDPQPTTRTGGPHGVDEIEPHHHTKE